MGLFGFGRKKERKEKQEEQDGGGFLGFVLLAEPVWDREQFKRDLLEDWGIDAVDAEEDADGEQYKDILLTEQGDMRLAVSFMPGPVPNGEAEHYAAANYLWPEAVEATKRHQAQILVAVLGDKAGPLEQGKLFTKAAASCLKQSGAVGIYTDGAVFQPEFYRDFAMLMKEGELPIMDWVWFGLCHSGPQAGVYTYGMKKFGRDEIEVYVDRLGADLNAVRDFMLSIVSYILESGAVLRDGETIGFSEDQKLPVTRSKGVALDGETLKIGYPG